MEEENEYDKLLSELDDIESSPIRPWKTINNTPKHQAPPAPSAPSAPSAPPAPAVPSVLLKAPAPPKREASWDQSDVGDEIEDLLGELDHIAANKVQQACASAPAPATNLPFRCKLVCMGAAEEQGLRPQMEDKHVLVPDFYPKSIEEKLSGARAFCAVFDGHSGSQISDYAAGRMPALLALEAWYRSPLTPDTQVHQVTASLELLTLRTGSEEVFDKRVRETRFRDHVVNDGRKSERRHVSLSLLWLLILLVAGSTANVALLLGDVLHVANLGDSRAVLCRNGFAQALSEDHKPDLPSEKARIESLDGRVEWRGCWRVIGGSGIAAFRGLAVSRALGDVPWKVPVSYVEGTPDVTSTKLTADDEFLIIGCDGVWDVLNNQEAVDLARPCRRRRVMINEQALERGSKDNVTVAVMIFFQC
ncbi:hypothetical protein GUITHDRAFT_69206 [Guillardia theta CCMP2712]|uniref:PPM-type phosphatase domain-containing protein n=1 Tax=Guillardia theta (strain CCMP2712) TaxID=905079 RepID=L1JIA7_GUITC|nr:hypothetical protein GUITHDRAFT_69206 [Guillardia theta CCMP2712]EKX47810.1 hypothetical protein GUITHDRAFT_69206 [Guillardia theta CCMP2712]|eukprot:XP_005834790.1 hypothetical protein GUITHDRAFT_69206 [Guillardia theta CCMP2712]